MKVPLVSPPFEKWVTSELEMTEDNTFRMRFIREIQIISNTRGDGCNVDFEEEEDFCEPSP